MASVFLSYARSEFATARHFAQALEKAGHHVWWDLHVRGGAQFSKVIEEALKAADAVVVLWSASAVDSPWVRDEAASGRDSGRLVPVTIDGTEPPLGFRQFQTIDLSRWKGRGNPPQLKTLLADVAATAAGKQSVDEPPPAHAEAASVPAREAPGSKPLLIGVAVAVVLLLAGGLYLLMSGRRTGVPSVSVAAGDSSPLSNDMAQNLLVKLGSLQSKSATTVRLPGATGASETDIRLTVNGRKEGQLAKASVSLVSGPGRDLLWSKDFEIQAASRSALDEAIAFAAASALGCAADEYSAGAQPLRSSERHLYMNACTAMDDAEDTRLLIPMFRKVAEQAPKFVAARAHLLTAEASLLSDPSVDQQSAERLRSELRQDVIEARKVDPELPEAAVADVEMDSPQSFLRSMAALDKAKAEHPDNATVLAERSALLVRVGRMSDAVEDAKSAADLRPFSPKLRANYVTILAYAGGISKAWGELAKIKQLWPASPPVLSADYAINLRFGDYEKTVRSSGQALEAGILGYLKILHDPSDANIDAWVEMARTHQLNKGQRVFVYQALGPLNRVDQVYRFVDEWPVEEDLRGNTYILFRPWLEKVRQDPRFMRLAQRLTLVDYWQKSGNWPDFCFDPGLPYDCKKEAARLQA